ncbi:MAG: hypothetical protein AAFY57_15030 [Cyanobacteria bacterium J06642_2]
MLDYHYDDFIRLSKVPIASEMGFDPWANAYFARFARKTDHPIKVMLQEGLKAHIDAGSLLAEHVRDAIALLLWADANRSAPA